MIQIAVYRNYNAPLNMLLQYSGWNTKPLDLKNFMNNVKADYGLGEEAIECGLLFANEEADQPKDEIPLSQVFLIGDAAPNTGID